MPEGQLIWKVCSDEAEFSIKDAQSSLWLTSKSFMIFFPTGKRGEWGERERNKFLGQFRFMPLFLENLLVASLGHSKMP